MLLILSACVTQTGPPPASQLLLTPAQLGAPCEGCAQATLVVAMTQQRINADHQAAAAAEAVRANAQATLVSAGSTQSAALTADAIHQTRMADLATTGAQAVVNQQYRDDLAAGTQTAIANLIATQGQVAAVTSQSYVDQRRQREEQRQGPITFLWVWCLPVFLVLFAGLVLWGVWRRLRVQPANQRILENPVDRLPAPAVEVPPHHHGGPLPYLDSDITDDGYRVTKPDDQVERWLDEVKDRLLDSDEKDKDGNTDA